MFQSFSGRTADDAWQSVADVFRHRSSSELAQPSRAGPTRELMHATLSIDEPRQRWVVSRDPAINPAFAIAEVVWIMAGRNDSAFLNYFNRELPKFAGIETTYHGAYGYRLRKHLPFDQLDRAYSTLLHQHDSRQVVLQIWDSRIDLPNEEGMPSSSDIPCNVLSMLKIRSSQLEWTQVLRSNDFYRGLPYNIVQFTSLQEIIAGWLGVEVGTYNQLSDSLHVYDNCCEQLAKSIPITVTLNTDSLALPRKESAEAFGVMTSVAEQVSSADVSIADLISLPNKLPIPPGYLRLIRLMRG